MGSLIRGSFVGVTDKGIMGGSLIKGSFVGGSLLKAVWLLMEEQMDLISPFLVTETTGEGAEPSCTLGRDKCKLPVPRGSCCHPE